ncbi:uncharacterized protein [Macrobrachium rosenbergii]|uniref:uncharacterized protein n=1 Tax=Macrobrachium rosenbergii TaxID=79674 RepID=UPI0034D3BE1F
MLRRVWYKLISMLHYLLLFKAPISAGSAPARLKLVCSYTFSHLQTVRCEEPGCTAVLHQPYGHVVCRSHSGCAVRIDDLIVWHPDGCEVCFALYERVQDESADQASRNDALGSLRAWVAGYGRNVPSGKPYVLDENIRNLLYPGAQISAAVPPEVAAPVIEQIRVETQPPQDENLYVEVSEEVAAINLDLEPMNTEQDQEVGREVSEVVGAGSLFDSPSSTASSFQGFQKSSYLEDRAQSAVLKLKKSRKAKGYKSATSRKATPFPPVKPRDTSPVASKFKATPSAKGASSRAAKASPPRQPAFDPEEFAGILLQKFTSEVDAKLNKLRRGCRARRLIEESYYISGNRLDLIFTDVPAIVKSKVCEFIGTSDHCTIELDISVNPYIPNATIGKTV